jgi:hypothetical protein
VKTAIQQLPEVTVEADEVCATMRDGQGRHPKATLGLQITGGSWPAGNLDPPQKLT